MLETTIHDRIRIDRYLARLEFASDFSPGDAGRHDRQLHGTALSVPDDQGNTLLARLEFCRQPDTSCTMQPLRTKYDRSPRSGNDLARSIGEHDLDLRASLGPSNDDDVHELLRTKAFYALGN